jgi:hypothetical protein
MGALARAIRVAGSRWAERGLARHNVNAAMVDNRDNLPGRQVLARPIFV